MAAVNTSSGANAALVARRLAAARLLGTTSQPAGNGSRLDPNAAAFLRALDIASRRPSGQTLQTTRLAATTQTPIRAVRQSDPREYDSTAQARTWGGSTCSAASLTAVLRSRGIPVRIADVMKAMPGAITPELGLVSRPALLSAAAKFGLAARDEVTSYDALQRATAAGEPVLVDIRNARFPDGHWIVITAADANGPQIADSSGYDMKSMTRADFLASWSGKGIRFGAGATV